MGVDTYAFAYWFDWVYALHHYLLIISGSNIPMNTLKDSEGLFLLTVNYPVTTVKILMVYIRADRQGYEVGEISGVGWIRSIFNLADGLTKFSISKALRTNCTVCICTCRYNS